VPLKGERRAGFLNRRFEPQRRERSKREVGGRGEVKTGRKMKCTPQIENKKITEGMVYAEKRDSGEASRRREEGGEG